MSSLTTASGPKRPRMWLVALLAVLLGLVLTLGAIVVWLLLTR